MAAAIESKPKRPKELPNMKMTYNTADLRAALSECFAVAPARTPKEILRHVYLGGGFMRATDLEMSLSIKMETSGPEMLLPPQVKQIVGLASGTETSIELGEKVIVIESGLDRWEVPITDPQDFPQFHPIEGDQVALPAGVLRKSILRCIPLVEDDVRYAFGALLLEGKFVVGGRASILVATDMPVDLPKCLLPVAAAKVLARLLDDEEQCWFSCDDNSARFEFGTRVFQSRQLNGRWPLWQKAIGETEYSALVRPSEFLSGVNKARISLNPETCGIDVAVDGTAGHFRLSGGGQGSSVAIVPAESCDAGGQMASIDWKYLSGFLSTVSDLDRVRVSFREEKKDVRGQVQIRTEDGTLCFLTPLSKDR